MTQAAAQPATQSAKLLAGKSALITAGGAGLGEAIALKLAEAGANVVIADLSSKRGASTVEQAEALGVEAFAVKMDVSMSQSVQEVIKQTLERFGRLDILVNNAGGTFGYTGKLADLPEDLWARTLAVNLTSVYLTSKYTIPHMLERGGGVILNIASVAGLNGRPNEAAYCAAKGGVVQLTRALAVEYSAQNIRVNCICPSFALTRGIERIIEESPHPEATRQHMLHGILVGHLADPKDIGEAALFLVSEQSRFITGVALPVDGGVSCHFAS